MNLGGAGPAEVPRGRHRGRRPAAAAAHSPLPAPRRDPFSLGVASGDPLPDSVVLWTRSHPGSARTGGGMPDRVVSVEWEVAEDERFRNAHRCAGASPRPGRSWAQRPRGSYGGLRPGRTYWYRFRVGGQLFAHRPGTRTGAATRTSGPAAGCDGPLASCQNWQHGYFTPYADMLDQDPDFVSLRRRLHLRVGPRRRRQRAPATRAHGEPYSLGPVPQPVRPVPHRPGPRRDARERALGGHFDDHEVDNDFAGEIPQDPDKQSHDAFVARLTAGHQAYYEHMPVRGRARMHRTAAHPDVPPSGVPRRLARLSVLDTRQYRSDQGHQPGGRPGPRS